MSWNNYRHYIPMATRRANAREELRALQAGSMEIEPLDALSHRTKIASSFWGRAWCDHMESLGDFANRLPRGRTYVRNGSVLHLAISTGTVAAFVQGSELYGQTIKIAPLSQARWQAIQSRCRGKVGSLIELLQGKISQEVMAIVTDPADGMFPSRKEIALDCSCPDWASMCKHVAAVLYGVGARLDSRPELLFTLRGVDQQDLISAAGDQISPATSRPPSSRRRTLDSSSLGDVFGIDLDDPSTSTTAPAPTTSGRPAKKSAKKPQKKARPAPEKKPLARLAEEPPPPPPFEPTAAAVRKLRKTLGLSRAAFAARLGVSPPSVTNWENASGTLNLQAASRQKLQALHRATHQ